jgi:8-oxo-dGTP pyrophosphatase MutT (NUDIX family)
VGYIEDIRSKIGNDWLIGVGACVFVYKDGKVLLQKRKDNLCWCMSGGGGVEIGESVEEAAKRELFEETGITAKSLELLGVFSGEGMSHIYPNGDKVQIIGIVYICQDFSGDLLPDTYETIKLEWFDIDKIPHEIHPPDKRPFEALIDWVRHPK